MQHALRRLLTVGIVLGAALAGIAPDAEAGVIRERVGWNGRTRVVVRPTHARAWGFGAAAYSAPVYGSAPVYSAPIYGSTVYSGQPIYGSPAYAAPVYSAPAQGSVYSPTLAPIPATPNVPYPTPVK